jgi:RND family efflux transporter MFP subunit
VLVILAAGACAKPDAARARAGDAQAKPVSVEGVREEVVRRNVDVVGTLAAVDEVTVSAEAEGRVSRVPADLGDRVHAGEILVELDREKLQYGLDQQRAALTRALAKYGASDTQHQPAIEQTPDVQKAAAELAQAKQGYDRAQELFKRELVPRQTLDDAEVTLHSKQASYDSALQNAKNLHADIDASDASVKLADRVLRDASIRAPFDGYVQKRMVSVGEFVKNQTPVMSIVRVDPLKVTGEISEQLAPWIKAGQPIELQVEAFPGKKITGKISRISPTVNTSTRAFSFEALVSNADAALKPGTFARVHVETTRADRVMTIPYDGIQYRYGVSRVFVVEGDHLAGRDVKTGERQGDRVEVIAGLKPGELVALTDVDRLSDGVKVTVKR